MKRNNTCSDKRKQIERNIYSLSFEFWLLCSVVEIFSPLKWFRKMWWTTTTDWRKTFPNLILLRIGRFLVRVKWVRRQFMVDAYLDFMSTRFSLRTSMMSGSELQMWWNDFFDTKPSERCQSLLPIDSQASQFQLLSLDHVYQLSLFVSVSCRFLLRSNKLWIVNEAVFVDVIAMKDWIDERVQLLVGEDLLFNLWHLLLMLILFATLCCL